MELELGLKVTRTREDVSSSVDFRFSKDPFGPLVLSQETDSRFIIIIHLKGFKKEGIEIDINKEGDRIIVKGRKPVEEVVMIRWMAWRKEVEMREFKKVFLIPDVVDLDKIKARFDDDDATLTITMPKRVKGISGFNLEQEEEEEGVDFADVSEVENREEVEEEDGEREFDEHSEIQGEEGFGDMVEDDERESQVNEGEEEGFSGGVDETQIEDDDLEEIQQIGQQELADSDTESEDSGFKKLPEIMEQEDNQEVIEQKVSEDMKSGDTGSRPVQEIEKQESDEDSGLKKIPEIIEQEVVEQKVSEEAKSDDTGSGAVKEIKEQESKEHSGSNTESEDSGLKKLPDIIEKEDNQEVMEQKVSEETKSDDIRSEAVKEIGEKESHEESALRKLPDIIEQEDSQEVKEQKVSEETKSGDIRSEAVKEIEEKESHEEESGLKNLQEIIEQKDNQEGREHKVSEETKIDDNGSGEVKEIEEQESDEVGGLRKSIEMEKKKNDAGNDDGGLRKAQGIEEPERHNEDGKIQDLVEEKINDKDAKGEHDGKETQTEDDNLEKSQLTDEEESVGQHEFADSNREIDDSGSLRKLPDVLEQKNNQEVMEQKDSQEESRSNDSGPRAFEEVEKQEPHEELDGTSKSRAKADDDGLRKVQGNEEPERRNEVSKIQEMVEGETSDHEKRKNVKMMETNSKDPKEDVDADMGEGFTPNTERTRLVAEDNTAETETKAEELASIKPEADKVDKKHELVEKKDKANDVSKPVQETEAPEVDTVVKTNEGKEKNSVKTEIKTMEEGFATKIADTETKPEGFESERKGADEVDKKHKLVEKKEANMGAKGEGKSLTNLQENEEQHSKGRKQQDKQENIKGLVEGKTPEAETDMAIDVPKPVQEIKVPEVGTLGETGDEGKQGEEKKSVANIVDTETKPEEFASDKPKPVQERCEGTNYTDSRKTQETIRQQDLDECEKERKSQELVKSKTNDEEKEEREIEETVEQESCRPKDEEDANLRAKGEDGSLVKIQENEEPYSKERKQQEKQENIKELVEERAPESEKNIVNDFSKPVQNQRKEVNEKKKESVSLEVRNRDTKEKVDAKMGVPDSAETETEPEEFESDQLKADKVEEIHELIEKKKEEEGVETESEDISLIKPQEIGEQQFQGQKQHHKQEKIEELVEEKTAEEETNDTLKPVQERCEEKQKIQKKFQEERKKHPEEHKEEMVETEKKFNGSGSREVQELDEAERCEKESKTQEVVKRKTSDEEVGVEMGKGFKPNIAETETKGEEFESQKLEPAENDDDIHKVVEKKEEEEKNAKVRRQSEDKSLIKLQENEKKHSKGQKQQEKTAETEVDKLGKTGDEGKEKKKSVSLIAKEEVDAQNGKGFELNTAESETKPEEFESDKLEADEVDELVEKKEEEEEDNAKTRRQSKDSNLSKKLHETKEQQFQAQKRHNKKEKIKDLDEEKTPAAETDTEPMEQECYRPKVFSDDYHHISRRVGDTGQRDSDAKEDVDPEMGTPNISETEKKAEEFESDAVKADQIEKIHELVEKTKKKKEENDKVTKQSEDTGLKRLQEEKFQGPNRHSKQEKTKELVEEKPVQETERPEVNTLEKCEEKVFSETETKDQESYRPKILEGEGKIQELAEEKMNFSRKVDEEEDIAENKTELGDDDMSRKASDIEQRGANEMKGQEEKEKIQELVLEEKVSDGGKKIVAEAIDKSRKVQEIDEQQSHEEDEHGNQFQKLRGGGTSGQGEVDYVESEKRTTEADKRFKDSAREVQEVERTDSELSGKYGKGDTFQELKEDRKTYENEKEEEKEDEDDRPERETGKIEQELVNLNSPMEKETGEKTQELVDEEINNCKEEETKTDDFTRKVQGTKEQELSEPKRNHGIKIKEVIEEKTAEAEKEDESGGLSKVQSNEEQESHERYKTEITGTEETNGQEKEEKGNSPNAQEIKDQRPDKDSYQKRCKIQELVEAGHNETEEDTSKRVQEIEQQEPDGLKRSVVQDKKQETEENEISRAIEKKEIVERMTKTEDVILRKDQDGEDPEMSRPYKRQEECKIQEPVEMGTGDYREKVKKQDGDDTLRSQEPDKPNLDELERHIEQKKIPQGEDKIQEPVDMGTHDYREKVKKQDGDDIPQSMEEEKMENMAEIEGKVEDDNSDKFHGFEERKSYKDWTHETWEKSKEEATDPKESEEKEKTRPVEEKNTLERRKRTRDGGLRKVQDDAEPELSKPYKPQEEDKVQESMGRGTSDYREEVKKQDGNDTLRSKGPKYKRTAEAGQYDHKEEQQEEKVNAKAELKAEEDTTEKIQEVEKHKSDELQRSLVQEKMQETEEKEKTRAVEENEIVERKTKTEDGSLGKVGEGKEAESSKPYKRLDEEKIQELEKMETSDYGETGKTQDGDDIVRSQETEKLDLVEEEATGLKDKHTGGKGEPEEERDGEVAQTETKGEDEINKEVEEDQKEEEDSLDDPMTKTEIHEKLDIVQDFVEEKSRDQEDEVAIKAAAVEANHHEDSSRILQTIEEHEEHKEQRNDPGVEGEDEERITEKERKEKEAFYLKNTGGEGHNDHKEEEQHEEKFIPKAEVKAEEDSSEQEFDELQRSLVQDKMQETEEKGKPRSVEENETVEGRTKPEEENLVDDAEKEELHESEKLDIVQDFVEDKTWDQADDRVGEAAAVVANDEKDSSRNLHTTTGGEELKEHEEHDEIPATSDARVKEEDGERVAEKETRMEKVHVQEPGGKTENKESRRVQKGKQEKNVETRSDDGTVRKVIETKMQESDGKKDQEPDEKIEELERKETSSHEVKLETEEDSLTKGQEFLEKESSKRRPVGQENLQQPKDSEKQEAGVEMQAKIGIRVKEQETKRQKPYKLLQDDEHEKIPEPVVEGTKYQKEEEKRVEDREAEDMKRKSEDVRTIKVQKAKAEESDGLEKHRKLSELQENQSVEEEEEEELNEAGEYKEVLKTKSMEDLRQSQDVEEKGLDPTERYAEQEEQMAEEEEEEQNEKAKRMPHVESKANDDSSKKNETERLRRQKQKEVQQEVVETETSDQRKEEKEENIVGKTVTRDECDSSRKNQDHEGEQLDKLGRHMEEEMSGSLAKEETSNDKEDNRGNRAGAKTTIKDEKKQLVLEKDISGKSKENRNQESKSRDDSSRENEKQESHEQKRNYEEQEKKKLGPNYYTSEEDGKEDKDISEAEGPRKLKGIEQREAIEMVERHDYQDNMTDLVEEQSDKPERRREEEIRRSLAREETSNDKEENRGNRAGAETTIKDDGFREEQLEIVLRHSEQDKKQLVVETDTSGKAKDKRNQETNSRDESSRKTRENEKQEPHEQKRYCGEQDKKNMGPDYCRNNEDGNLTDLVEEKMKNQEKEDKKNMFMEVWAKSKDHESKEPERLRKQDKGSELMQQRSTGNLKDEETTKTETKVKDKESRKTHQQLIEEETGEEERLKEKENRETESEDGSSKKIKEIDKEGSCEPRRDEERDKIQPVDSETSEDDSEELKVEVEDSEEDWEAEVIQEMDSDEDNDKARKIRRIKLGFRLVGGSTLFMSLIVIVISIIRSKRKTRCYKF